MTNGDGTPVREILLEAKDIHKALLERNKNHFHQAHDTPFGGGIDDGILADLVKYLGLKKAAKDIVNGDFMELHGRSVPLLPETEQLIIELAMPDAIRMVGKLDSKITAEDFTTGFKAWKESTATSPSGRHHGHYKALVLDPEKKHR